MTKKIDIFITSLFLVLFGWASIHGLTYDTFNSDSTYSNTLLDRILPVISLVGNIMIIYSLFIKVKKRYLIYRLTGACLIIPLIINYHLMGPFDSTLLEKVFASTFNTENSIITVFVILSLYRRF